MRPEEPSGKLAPSVASGDGGDSDEDGFRRTSILAVVSMGLPFVSILLFMLGVVSFREWTRVAFYLPPAALVLGIVALLGIRRSGGRLGGRGFATAGIVLGLGGTLAIVMFVLAVKDMMCGYEGSC